ncbi:AAA family ATPase [Pseudomonas oryzihabitans]|uniref:AAA family ATPase n=1 Tax=Pseudomonas oryzihabitans TaxID=47885 RepID=UPI001D611C03|nr:AAA family ATPase [Pseudomonas oryzihabitans]HJE71680.1 AAA family ATPase [Pseudomonas oryzihabitans]
MTSLAGAISPLDVVLSRLERPKKSGKHWIACCPAHEDRSPSLSVSESDDGKALVHCFAGCETRDVLGAIGLDLKDLFPNGLSVDQRLQYQRRSLEAARSHAQLLRDLAQANISTLSVEDLLIAAKAEVDVKEIDGQLAKLDDAMPANEDRFTLIDASALEGTARAPEYLIEGMIEKDAHGIMGGASMTFKSFIALHIAYSICTGQPFMDCKVYHPGKVVYVCGEGEGGIARRLRALAQELGDIPAGRLFVVPGALRIDDPIHMADFGEQLKQLQPQIVMFDTFASLCGGTDENSPSEVGPVLRRIKETCRAAGASSLIVHHFGKDADRGFRGASNFTNDVDYAFTVKRDGDNLRTCISSHKCKDGEPFKPVHVGMTPVMLKGLADQEGREVFSLMAVQAERSDSQPSSEGQPMWARALHVLQACFDGQKTMLEMGGKPFANPTVTWDDWSQAMADAGIKNGRRERDKLKERDLIESLSGNEYRPKPK